MPLLLATPEQVRSLLSDAPEKSVEDWIAGRWGDVLGNNWDGRRVLSVQHPDELPFRYRDRIFVRGPDADRLAEDALRGYGESKPVIQLIECDAPADVQPSGSGNARSRASR